MLVKSQTDAPHMKYRYGFLFYPVNPGWLAAALQKWGTLRRIYLCAENSVCERTVGQVFSSNLSACTQVNSCFLYNRSWLKVLLWLVPRRAYTASLGETAVAFDFGPLVPVPKNILGQRGRDEVLAYPLYILYENGETFLTYISLLQR